MSGSVITVLAGLSAVAATVLAFIFIVPEKKRASLNGFFKSAFDKCVYSHNDGVSNGEKNYANECF